MKYSLRSLMIVLTLACVLLGSVAGRIEYLRRWEAFHMNECERHARTKHQSIESAMPDAAAALQHGKLAWRFHTAIFRPWTIVDTSPPELLQDDREVAAYLIANGEVDELLAPDPSLTP